MTTRIFGNGFCYPSHKMLLCLCVYVLCVYHLP